MAKLFSWFKKDKQKEEKTANEQATETANTPDVDATDLGGKTPDLDATDLGGKTADVDASDLGGKPLEDEEADTKKAELQTDNAVAPNAQDEKASSETQLSETQHSETQPTVVSDTQSIADAEELKLQADKHKPETEQAESENAVNTDSASSKEQTANDVQASETPAKQSFFARLKSSLSRTKASIGSGFSGLLRGKSIDDDLYEELETQLLVADVGMNTTSKIIDKLTEQAKRSQLKDGEALSVLLQKQMQDMLDDVNKPIDFSIAVDEQGQKVPFVILMVGVNGVGKTTTIGKLAKQYQAQGKSVMLAAGDTFRAAAVEQLQVWGERNNIPVVAQHTGADSASVLFDAIASAQSKKADILIADTAGRLQNKNHLIEELKKVVRVMKKKIPNAPHEIMLTLDASTGQNAVSQTKIFNEAVGITGINLTKLDGTAKGGVIFALADEFNIPVRYIGIGEGIDDLREFDAKAFVEALFAE